MKKRNGVLIYSPSDITTFIESPFASWMDRFDKEFPGKIEKDKEDESEILIQERGMAHERRFLAKIQHQGSKIVTVREGDFSVRHADTIKAMEDGSDFIYQGALAMESFEGYADFLKKVPGKSKLGDYHYEAWDSKLARSVKPYFVIQLLAYSEMLEVIQGVFPEKMTVVLGTNVEEVLKSSDYRHYYLSVKRRFLDFHSRFSVLEKPTPQKNEELRSWSNHAAQVILDKDDLSQVANIKVTQIRKLEKAGIDTLTKLGLSNLEKVQELEKATFQKLKRQARLQLESKGRSCPKYEVLNHDDEEGRIRGLKTLPPKSAGDVYFDMEGYPLFEDTGLEYLFGAIYQDQDKEQFIDFWAHSRAQEKIAFEQWIDWVYARFKKDPQMHIYHYAPYEVTAMQRLSTQHATRESQVDELLKGQVFVDLYKIVSQSLVVGEPSYSIKFIEHLYDQKRTGDVKNAAASIVQYARYLDCPDGSDHTSSPTLKEIRNYNEIDCISTLKLCDWLRNVQKESELNYVTPDSVLLPVDERENSPAAKLAASLLAELDGIEVLNADQKVQKVLAELLEFHRREGKQYWWRYYTWIKCSHDELVDDADCLGNLQRTNTPVVNVKKSKAAEYSFNPSQDKKFSIGGKVKVYVDFERIAAAEITELDSERGLICLKIGPTGLEKLGGFPLVASLLPGNPIDTSILSNAIFAVAEEFSNNRKKLGVSGAIPSAISDLLYRRSPRITGHAKGTVLLDPEKATLQQTIDIVKRLDKSTICIQGPPGAGKTFTGARVILALLKDGKRVGITSNSHQVIENVMKEVMKIAGKDDSEKLHLLAYKSGGEDDFFEGIGINPIESSDVGSLLPGKNGHYLVGGTAWMFSRDEAINAVDYLFVDEAGQVSLSNLVAMSRSTENIVLMGDQRQLEQPIQGSHPGESGKSCLSYLIQDHATIPEHLGIFLGTTFRMRPSVCKFISDRFYESRLLSDPSTLTTELTFASDSASAGLVALNRREGILFVPVEHEDRSQSSPEEVSVIHKIISDLLKERLEENGKARAIALKDILVVAPYNLQVQALKQALPSGIDIGTVDKFQGREAAIVILSMCSSSLDLSPRGVDFLFNPNRINVAISRAKCLAIVVGNPALQLTNATSIEKMKLVNLFCSLIDESASKI